ncbi:quinolinate synthase NadA [Haloferax mediterranei ATCC 33500]|uniref:Quinolinate synthase n=1 Tax=Haloferax mediterranei (strain ATCC 33500 / DSM 1411 / JCM 8866 / NBRC 14739 / NCIMB 2177 / R-4) TaxID=523841 RepID=I3R7S5_HALMT|nr:quinolinate synthase NadA [Haloferax mediterranei]AFK20285.1 quinolinate synthetase [Haloferax mediterranei ATCC 33500]AHZ23654.1 quinolinate synthetase [Haloferax mediterranei ATCC 33500]ELZ99141.1 quinolinate synthetase [Haloferax mediterranei ATCC 33500]MDX5986961.1 quinolinate synthase NadA [Haloferax mediterranei ATCC 33500]QCQ76279.1 quinolinate synthase NadA [Haloferax mediterranei ATCC 33500]
MVELESVGFESDLSLFKYDTFEQLPESHRDLDEEERSQRIAAAREQLGDRVIVLGHNYQRREIVEHADFIGDSYELSKRAAESDAEYVVFGGVTFMAESADIITDDDQTVILPSMEASCPMAGMAEAVQVDSAWEELVDGTGGKDIIPVTYMNSYADLKAFCASHGGLICTSSNATDAFEWAFERGDAVLFLPDKHLGRNTANDLGIENVVEWDPWAGGVAGAEEELNDEGDELPGLDDADLEDAEVILWDGYCQVHERFEVDHVEDARDAGANVVVHPECRPSVVAAADEVGSTSHICDVIANADPGETWAIGTEVHLARHLARWHPEVDVRPLCGDACMDCNAMRQVDPNYLTWVLEELAAGREPNVVEVAPEEKELAAVALDRMLEL